MTNVQKSIVKYINKNFVEGSVKIIPVEESKVKIIDANGESMTFTANLYCDIIDTETGKIVAKSNLPHDLMKIGCQMPTDWEELPR